jgi:hypothetical protein
VSPFAILALIVAHSLFWRLTSLRKQCKIFALVAAQLTPKFVISWLRARIGHKPINLGWTAVLNHLMFYHSNCLWYFRGLRACKKVGFHQFWRIAFASIQLNTDLLKVQQCYRSQINPKPGSNLMVQIKSDIECELKFKNKKTPRKTI